VWAAAAGCTSRVAAASFLLSGVAYLINGKGNAGEMVVS